MKDEASYICDSCEEKQIVLVDLLLQNAPALEGKPAEWEEAGPCLVMQQ
jgi:hypothetical protein